jgi:hypothetical protein
VRVYRTKQESNFTPLPNALLQRHDLSFVALGIVAFLLSQPDGNDWTVARLETARKEGKVAVRAAVEELKAAGFYIKENVHVDGKLRGVTAVYDVPQNAVPLVALQTADGQTARIQPVCPQAVSLSAVNPKEENPKDEVLKEGIKTPLPAVVDSPADDMPAWAAATEPTVSEPESATEPSRGGRAVEVPDKDETAACEALVERLAREVPRLTVGVAEMGKVLPLVSAWRERGASDRQIIAAVAQGLPEEIHSPVGLILNRLTRKMPPAKRVIPVTSTTPMLECDVCGNPLRGGGVCRGCRTADGRSATATADDSAMRGASLARELCGWSVAS